MRGPDVGLERLLRDPRMPLAGGDMLLAAGDLATEYNAMTVAWGGFGTMWNRPVAIVVVRPCRHTFGFMERHPTFTLSAFPEGYEAALSLLGRKSGRDGDKIAEAGLTPVASRMVAAPSFAEADLVVECRVVYSQDLEPSRAIDPAIARCYPDNDWHRVYWGEILVVRTKDDSAR